MLDPEEYVIQDVVPCRENDMCYYTFDTMTISSHQMSNLWRAGVKTSTSEFCPIGKMHGFVVKNHTLHVFCKRKDLPVIEKPADVKGPIFGSLPTHPIDKNGGWYVTANGLVVLLDKKTEPLYSYPECHKPSRKVNHGLDLMEAVWWHPNGEVYFKNDTERKLCQPLLRIVAKLQNFHESPPVGFVFKHGFPKFEKPEDGADYCTKYVVSGDARIILISTNQESSQVPVTTQTYDLLFGDKPTIPPCGEGVYITADGSVAIIDKDGRDTNTVFKISESKDVSNVLWNVGGFPVTLDCHRKLRLVAKICDKPIKEIVDKTGNCSLIGAKMRPFSQSDGFSHYIAICRLSGVIQTDQYGNFLRPVTLVPADLCFFGQNRIFVNPILTPVSKEVVMSPTQEVPPSVKSQNPVVQIAKATGNFAARSANYWFAQPTMIMGKAIISSLRFIFASAIIGGIVCSISYPETAKKVASSMIPKVEIKIEKPSILK